MKNKPIPVVILIGMIGVTFACGSVSGTGVDMDEETSPIVVNGESLAEGAVSSIDLSSSSTRLEFDELAGDEVFVLALHAYNPNGTTYAYELGDESAGPVKESGFLTREDATEDVHGRLRNLEATAAVEADSHGGPDMSLVQYASRAVSLGARKKFKVLNSFSSSGGTNYDEVVGQARYIGDDFVVYVDTRVANNLTDEDLAGLYDPFNELTDDEREIFGDWSDINGDGKFDIFMTPTVNALGYSAGGIVTGFFYGVDLLPGSSPLSNGCEVLYTLVPDPSGNYGIHIAKEFALSNLLKGVPLHELQHMINFNQHYFEGDGALEVSALNEGLSHVAEGFANFDDNGVIAATGIENPARMRVYLNQIATTGLLSGSGIGTRGGMTLLLEAMYTWAESGLSAAAIDGADLLNRLASTSKSGAENLVNAYFGAAYQGRVAKGMMELTGNLSVALVLDDSGLNNANQYRIDTVNLRGPAYDNRQTVLAGPSIQDFSGGSLTDTLPSAGITFIRLTAAQIEALGGGVTIAKASNMVAAGHLIRVTE